MRKSRAIWFETKISPQNNAENDNNDDDDDGDGEMMILMMLLLLLIIDIKVKLLDKTRLGLTTELSRRC